MNLIRSIPTMLTGGSNALPITKWVSVLLGFVTVLLSVHEMYKRNGHGVLEVDTKIASIVLSILLALGSIVTIVGTAMTPTRPRTYGYTLAMCSIFALVLQSATYVDGGDEEWATQWSITAISIATSLLLAMFLHDAKLDGAGPRPRCARPRGPSR